MFAFLNELQVRNTVVVVILPAVGIWLSLSTPFTLKTQIWTLVYYFATGLGITAGYHRLWSHKCYCAELSLQVYLAVAGGACFQGSIRDWCRDHRAHHRYVDTERDPYSISNGFWHAHMGWLFFKPKISPEQNQTLDLNNDRVVQWQHRNFAAIAIIAGLGFPALVANLLWDDWKGGLVYAGILRIFFFQQSTFCVNSLAHWLGSQPYDDKNSPRDHLITALVTFGEGYHNFHHEFPSDYRNGVKWYHYDPSKWFIWISEKMKLANNLKTFPDHVIRKGEYQQERKSLEKAYSDLTWGSQTSSLPLKTWEEFQQDVEHGIGLFAIDGFLYDVQIFISQHPGGKEVLSAYFGRDASTAFNGGIYKRQDSNAARNLLDDLRVGLLAVETDKLESLRLDHQAAQE